MSLTKPLNSKVNMKQYSNADLPVNPKQPAIARYAAESSASQTVITFPFQIDTVNAADSLILTVDGKVMTPGATNDYQFSGVDSFGFTNSVTMNFPLSAGLNIQAIKLGLKKETEFAQDARFTALYESIDQGLQGFIRTSDLMVATTGTGSPGNGLFYSSIVNRASLPDLRSDLKVRMGIERIQTQSIFQIQNEFGPNGETVWGVANDTLGQIRFIGSWGSLPGAYGQEAYSTTVGDSVEITFYGTGLNVLTFPNGGARSSSITVDGIAAGTFTQTVAAQSTVIANRSYSANMVAPAVTGLALGVHTVKLTMAVGALDVQGFEILNEVSSLRVNPGSSYLAGKKATTIAQQTLAYNSSFEAGTLGTRGGRVVVYQKADGTIAKAVQPVDAAQANLTSANHQNEEIARAYHFREFGSGRSDDFSTLTTSTANRSFTLDDGTTTLVGNQVDVPSGASQDLLRLPTNGTTFITFTFVGTGLDLLAISGTNGDYSASVNGTSVGNLVFPVSSGGVLQAVKVVSGLPYGSHSVRISRIAAGGGSMGLVSLLTYQPKKPSIPAGAVELADYNLMADYSGATITGTAVADNQQMPLGCLYKVPTREHSHVGANQQLFPFDAGSLPGLTTTTLTNNGQTTSYTFFGTGLVLHMGASVSGTYDFSVSIDGSLNATGVARSNASNLGSGSYRSTASASAYQPCRVEFTGLSMGRHTITLQRTAGSGNITFQGVHIITPIHSAKSNLYSELQNTLTVGSQAISDNRKTSIVRETSTAQKAKAMAYGISASGSTSLTTFVPMPDMTATVKTTSGLLEINYSASLFSNSASGQADTQIFVDGVPVGQAKRGGATGSQNFIFADSILVQVSPGVHTVQLCYRAATAIIINYEGPFRNLSVKEL